MFAGKTEQKVRSVSSMGEGELLPRLTVSFTRPASSSRRRVSAESLEVVAETARTHPQPPCALPPGAGFS